MFLFLAGIQGNCTQLFEKGVAKTLGDQENTCFFGKIYLPMEFYKFTFTVCNML